MRVALVNPAWSFDGSIYFGCRHPHLPLEYGAAKVLLEEAGHAVDIVDGHLFGLTTQDIVAEVRGLRPDMTVVTTAPSYLFWRCAPPELRVPQELLQALDGIGGRKVAVGPHVSSTPRAAFRKLGVDLAVMGECEEALAEIAGGTGEVPGTVLRRDGEIKVLGGPRATRFTDLPALQWGDEWIRRHDHHHHRFDVQPIAFAGPGAELESSRGCPYHCTFCAKENYRDRYRRRDLRAVMAELDRLIGQGVEYVYFIDEIFLPNRPLLEALVGRGLKFGVQTRIDLWNPDMLRLLGAAGCVSIEAGVESLTPEGRDALDKKCKLTTDELAELLLVARRHVPFVQANLIEVPDDDDQMVQDWRNRLRSQGVWANDPVPLFPYPGSPDYRKLWGFPDDQAWERAVSYYLDEYVSFSDIQEQRPLPLYALELPVAA